MLTPRTQVSGFWVEGGFFSVQARGFREANSNSKLNPKPDTLNPINHKPEDDLFIDPAGLFNSLLAFVTVSVQQGVEGR